MKKAFTWCDTHGSAFAFHDYQKLGVESERLEQWCRQLGWQSLVNTRGTTWRRLTARQQAISNQRLAVALMVDYPSLIKRRVVETGTQLLVGFDPRIFASSIK